MRKKVLAASYHIGGMNAIIPVIKKLKEDKDIDVSVFAHKYAENALQSGKIDYKKISDYGFEDISEESMNKILEQENPDLVLTGTSSLSSSNTKENTLEKLIISATREKNIPSLAVLDFWSDYSLRFDDAITGEKLKFLPDRIAIMDAYAGKDMINEGFPNEKLIITGNPHFDNLGKRAENFKEEDKYLIRKQLGLDSDLVIFYSANSFKSMKEEYGFWDLDNIILMNETLNNLPQEHKDKVKIGVKLHPRSAKEDVEEISNYLKSHSENKIKLITDVNPQDMIMASDATIVHYSTTGIEAVYMKKPCISLQPGQKGKDYFAILTKNNIVPVAYTKEDCKKLLEKVIIDKNYREKELIEKASSFRTDGKATERVTSLVYDMLDLKLKGGK